jgi:CubicO group peptidase (beta-lactamase class C family)
MPLRANRAGSKLPMEKDTICRVYSTTKPLTSVAVMVLVEEGKLSLSDRVDQFIPEFKDVKVFVWRQHLITRMFAFVQPTA